MNKRRETIKTEEDEENNFDVNFNEYYVTHAHNCTRPNAQNADASTHKHTRELGGNCKRHDNLLLLL